MNKVETVQKSVQASLKKVFAGHTQKTFLSGGLTQRQARRRWKATQHQHAPRRPQPLPGGPDS